METVKTTLGLGTWSVIDVKSEFFIISNYDFCLIRLLDYRRSVIDYDRRDTNMKKVRFIKNADKARHEMNWQNIPVYLIKYERNKLYSLYYENQPVSLMQVITTCVIFNQWVKYNKRNNCLNKVSCIGTIDLELISGSFITLKCAHWMRY